MRRSGQLSLRREAFLGHSDQDVMDSYIQASLDDVRHAVNRAARSIDGETPAGAIPFLTRSVAPGVAPPWRRPN